MISLLVAFACLSTAPAQSQDGLHGVRPESAKAAPEFQAVNRDGFARSKADLAGHPTVLWFYPMAGTPG